MSSRLSWEGCEGPIRRTREGGSEWELIKILLEGDGNSNKMNTASNTRLRLTTQIGQAHVATGVPLDLGTNTQPSDPRTQRNTKPRVHWPTPVRRVSTTGQTGPCWWNLATSTKWLHTGQAGATHRSDRSKPESPQIAKQANRPPNWPKLKTAPTQDNSKLTQMFTRAKNPPRVAPVRQVRSTGQTGVAWAARDEQHPRVNSTNSKPRSPESLHGLEQDFGDNRNTSWGVHRQV
jgi:NAD-dependent oxidoreductase involved in siderophore biosynthesis